MRRLLSISVIFLSLLFASCSNQKHEAIQVDLTIYLPYPNSSGHFYLPVYSDYPTYFYCSDLWLYDYQVFGSQSFPNDLFDYIDELPPDCSFSVVNSAKGVDDFSFCIHTFSIYYDHTIDRYGHSSNADLEQLWFFSIDSWYDAPSEDFLYSFTFDVYSPLVYEWLESSPFEYRNFLHHVFTMQLNHYALFSSSYEPWSVPDGLISSMNSLVRSMKLQFPEAPLGTLGYAVLDALQYYWR